MNSLQLHCSVHFLHRKNCFCHSILPLPAPFHFPGKINFRESFRGRGNANSFCCFSQSDTKESSFGGGEILAGKEEQPPFDSNLAVILAGFAFEAYTSHPGASDLYVVMDFDGQVPKSKTKWGSTNEPKWNGEFVFNIKLPPAKKIQLGCKPCYPHINTWGTPNSTWNVYVMLCRFLK